jgi:hypothetical protein
LPDDIGYTLGFYFRIWFKTKSLRWK